MGTNKKRGRMLLKMGGNQNSSEIRINTADGDLLTTERGRIESSHLTTRSLEKEELYEG